MTITQAITEQPGAQLTVDVHYGRFMVLDQAAANFRTRLKRDMPRLNLENLVNAGDRWVISVRDGADMTGMAIFSGPREAPVMDFYYATDAASTGMLMGAINQWRKSR